MIKLIDLQLPGYTTTTIDELTAAINDNSIIQLDTETTGLLPFGDNMLLIQFGISGVQYVCKGSRELLLTLKPYIELSQSLFLLANAKFDLKWLLYYNIDIHNMRIHDTQLAEMILTSGYDEQAVSLKDLAYKYCNVILDKTVRGQIHWRGYEPIIIEYAAKDVMYLQDIMNKQMEEIKKLELINVLNLEMEAVKVFALMEYHGILIDVSKWTKQAKEIEKQLLIIEEQLDDVVIAESMLRKYHKALTTDISLLALFNKTERKTAINYSSNAQKASILRQLNIDTKDTSEDSLQKVKHKHPLIPKLLDYNRHQKLVSSFGMNFLKEINKYTNRIHPDVWQCVATGRISMNKPNILNIPRKGDTGKIIRSCFISRPSYVLVDTDYNSMELRLMAEFSQEPVWVKAFQEGKDLHSEICAKTFNIALADVKKPYPEKPDITYRDVIKLCNFGLSYGLTEYKLADKIQISKEKAAQIIKDFFAQVPVLEQFLLSLGWLGVSRGYIRTAAPYRRIRWFPKQQTLNSLEDWERRKITGEIERESKNTVPQGTNGDILKAAIIRINNRIYREKLDAQILLTVYDEVLSECKEEIKDYYKQLQEQEMIAAAKEVIKTTPVVVESSVDTFWHK